MTLFGHFLESDARDEWPFGSMKLPSEEQKAARPSNFLDARLLQAHTPLLAADTRHVSRKPTTTKSSSRDKRIDASDRHSRARTLRKAVRIDRRRSWRDIERISERQRVGQSRLPRDLTSPRELTTFRVLEAANDTPEIESTTAGRMERDARVTRMSLGASFIA